MASTTASEAGCQVIAKHYRKHRTGYAWLVCQCRIAKRRLDHHIA